MLVSFRRTILGALGAIVSGCCFGGVPALPGAGPPPPPVAAVPPGPVALQTIMVGAGLTPDPTVVAGAAGGPLQGSSLAPDCFVGNYPAQPQLTLRLGTALPALVLETRGEVDLTMAVRRPNGTFFCNDDGGAGFNARFAEAAVPGDYTVYVGTFGARVPAPYTLGVSTIAAMDGSVMDATPIRHGQLRVLTSTGPLGVPVGSLCDYVQVAILPGASGLDVRWRVRCGDHVVYGHGREELSAGYSFRSRPDWPPGTLVVDRETTAGDQDPSFVWTASEIRIADDATGWNAMPYDLTFAEVR